MSAARVKAPSTPRLPQRRRENRKRRMNRKATCFRRLVLFVPPAVRPVPEDFPPSSVNYSLMLNEKQFRDRALRELREIAKQVQSLKTDRDLSRKLESEVVAANPQLAASTNPYLSMIRGAYTDATTMRLRRLFAPDANLSLRRLLAQIQQYPDMLHGKLTGKELSADLAELDRLGAVLKEHVDPHFAAHERTPAALESANRELDRAIDLLADCVRRYYWIVADAYIELEPTYAEDPLAVFRCAWIESK